MADSFDVLVFGAHPDDAEMGMGGTMIKLVKAGFRVKHYSLTRGEMGTHGTVQTRKREFEAACRLIGCSGEILDFPDTGVENTRAGRVRIAAIIREHTPRIVFAPYHTNPVGELGGLNHTDHYATGQLVRDGVKFARLQNTIPDMPKHTIQKLYFYMVPKNVNAFLYVDVSAVIDQTMQAVEAYTTQMAIQSHGSISIKDYLLTRRAATGHDMGVKYAERFLTDLPVVLKENHFFEV